MIRYNTVDVTDYIDAAIYALEQLEEVAHMSAGDQELIETALGHLRDALDA